MTIKTRFSVEQLTHFSSIAGSLRADALELAADGLIHFLNHGTCAVAGMGYKFLNMAEKPKKGKVSYTHKVYFALLKLNAFKGTKDDKFQSIGHRPLVKQLRDYVATLPETTLSEELMPLIMAWLVNDLWIEPEAEPEARPELSADIKKALAIVPATTKGFEGLSDNMVAALKSVWLAASGEPWSEGSVKRIKASQ